MAICPNATEPSEATMVPARSVFKIVFTRKTSPGARVAAIRQIPDSPLGTSRAGGLRLIKFS